MSIGLPFAISFNNRQLGGAVIPDPPDAAPSDGVLTVLSDTSIKFDFTINATNADGHSIERSTDGVTYTEIDTVTGSTATFTDTGLTGGTIYYYKARAYKGSSYSEYCTAVSSPTLPTPLLDLYGTSTFAYSLRLLNSSYTGYCLRVVRVSDLATLDIGFVNNYLDTASLSTFVGASDGRVSIWYDQSGNGNNATYLTTAPKIISSGVIVTDSDGNIALDFNDGTNYPMFKIPKTIYAANAAELALYSVYSLRANGAYPVLFGTSNETGVLASAGMIAMHSAATRKPRIGYFRSGADTGIDAANALTVNQTYLRVDHLNRSTGKIYVNGTEDASGADNNSDFDYGHVNVTISVRGTNYFCGYASEMILFTNVTNRTSIEDDIQSFYGVSLVYASGDEIFDASLMNNKIDL
jgi:hypothetical protein